MAELGTKHECYSCSAKFYDLGQSQAICPKCGADQSQSPDEREKKEAAPKRKRGPAQAAKAADKAKEEKEDLEKIEDEELDEEELEGDQEEGMQDDNDDEEDEKT